MYVLDFAPDQSLRRVLPCFLHQSVCIAILILASTNNACSSSFRWLDWKPLAWLGTVSYSVYVWQEFFFLPRAPHVAVVMISIAPAFALASYYLIERPCTRLGRKLTDERVGTPPPPEGAAMMIWKFWLPCCALTAMSRHVR